MKVLPIPHAQSPWRPLLGALVLGAFGMAGPASAGTTSVSAAAGTTSVTVGIGIGSPPSTIAVPADYPSIQAAINAAKSGDTIVLADGTYTGPGNYDLTFLGKALTIQSAHGAASTIIDGGGSHRGFSFSLTGLATLKGLTIKNGNGGSTGGGINIGAGAAATLVNCILKNNTASNGGGIYNLGALSLTNCVLVGNTSQAGGALLNTLTGVSTLTGCSFSANTATVYGGGGIYSRGKVTATGCILYGDSGTTAANAELLDTSLFSSYTSNDIGGYVGTGYVGTGNVSVNPKFVSPSDLHLLHDTPCLGIGVASSTATTDLDGVTRLNPPTLGAYEAPRLQSVAVTPAVRSIVTGLSRQFTATATYSDSSTANVTAQATWTSSAPTVATVNAAGLTTGLGQGTAQITSAFNGITAAPLTLTVLAPAATYQALWNRTDGGFSVWDVAAIGAITAHDFDAVSGYTAQSLAISPDGHAHVLLAAQNGAIRLCDAANPTTASVHGTYTQADYGPYNSWKALGLTVGKDSNLRVLWNRSDNRMSIWTLRADGSYIHDDYGPFDGWSAKFFSVAPDNTLRVLWLNTSGAVSVWIMAPQAASRTSQSGAVPSYRSALYGPYPGWTPTSLTTGPDGMSHIVWNHAADGVMSLWQMNDAFQFLHAEFGPYTNWTASSQVIGSDNTVHLGWTTADGQASLWNDLPGTDDYYHYDYSNSGTLTALSVAP